MTTIRIAELRALARAHKGKTKSADIILECLDELERVQSLYCVALEVAYRSYPAKGVSLSQLKRLVEKV